MSARVWVVLQQRKGALHPMSREAVAAGRELAAALGGETEAVLLGAGVEAAAEEVAKLELAAVRVFEDAALADYTPGAYAGTLAAAVHAAAPGYVVLPHTYQSVDYMARLAHLVDGTLVPEAVGFRRDGDSIVFRRPVFGGKLVAEVRARGEGPVVVSVQAGAFAGADVPAGEAPVQREAPAAGAAVPDREILGVEEAAGEQVDLSQAERIVAVGRGIGSADNLPLIEELAGALGAEIGASRPVIDSGWLPRDRQIGSSGQTVAPKLYLAAGISGAIQHLVGMKGSQVVVAINKDPNAPIFGVARYGVVGDLLELLPALTAAVKEARG